MRRPRVLLAATGGTIATAPGGDGVHEVGRRASDLVATVPGLVELAEFECADPVSLPSHALTPEHMCRLAHLVAEADCEGVVITHGTDTLEETAYALAVMLERRVPVVLTGAMRLPGRPGADGPANLLAAVRVAMTPAVAALGPVVVLQDEIHLARYVAKVHTGRVAAFASPGLGPVGSVVEDHVQLQVTSAPSDHLGLPARLHRRVELVWAYAGAGGELLEACRGAAGVVLAGTGGGHVPPAMLEALERLLAAGVPVVVASRTGSGPTLEGSYGGRGSESELRRMGVLAAGTLGPLKARLRLQVALELGLDPGGCFPA
ncbi:MAG TPA: asparaginase [Candidatus Dormibacteraeota bacterium]|nr:asparaginase [Candidatus Dormibacteraeota bacterium]